MCAASGARPAPKTRPDNQEATDATLPLFPVKHASAAPDKQSGTKPLCNFVCACVAKRTNSTHSMKVRPDFTAFPLHTTEGFRTDVARPRTCCLGLAEVLDLSPTQEWQWRSSNDAVCDIPGEKAKGKHGRTFTSLLNVLCSSPCFLLHSMLDQEKIKKAGTNQWFSASLRWTELVVPKMCSYQK